jgi:hypothetical protein
MTGFESGSRKLDWAGATAEDLRGPEPIVWTESEWADRGSSAELAGIVADVWFEAFDFWTGESSDKWAWRVVPTGSRCEWPEAWATGTAKTETAARGAAMRELRRADRAYPKEVAR